MRTIRWTHLAKRDYFDNIDYLLKEWSEKEAQKFIDEVYDTEFLLKQGNIDFQNTDLPEIKKCVICKQVTLFYRVVDEQNIEFLRFWNNLQDNRKLHL
jgi:plasmid stabilization system protein ParE